MRVETSVLTQGWSASVFAAASRSRALLMAVILSRPSYALRMHPLAARSQNSLALDGSFRVRPWGVLGTGTGSQVGAPATSTAALLSEC